MFINSFFREFDDDPFFSMHRDHIHEMDDMFGGMFSRGADRRLALADNDGNGDRQRSRRHEDRSGSRDLEPVQDWSRGSQDMVAWDPFAHMNKMMSFSHNLMGNIFKQMENVKSDPNGHSYVQSSFMSYSNTGQGEPKVFQATSATRQAPGGVRETRKAVRDSEKGIEKMAVGRHLNERGHVVTRERNTRTGDINENQDYLNLDEAEAPQFDEEWRNVTSRYRNTAIGQQHSRAIDDRHHRTAAYDTADKRAARPTASKHRAIDDGRHAQRTH